MRTDIGSIAATLKLLANENRLQILCELIDSPRNVGGLRDRLGNLTQSALSQHLALLKACGMVEDRRSGQTVTYRIADPRVEKLIAALRGIYCEPRGALAEADPVHAPEARTHAAEPPAPHDAPNPF